MKKKNLKSLKINKQSISSLKSFKFMGGREVSIKETNCDYCPPDRSRRPDNCPSDHSRSPDNCLTTHCNP